jgi:hypothetical protein
MVFAFSASQFPSWQARNSVFEFNPLTANRDVQVEATKGCVIAGLKAREPQTSISTWRSKHISLAFVAHISPTECVKTRFKNIPNYSIGLGNYGRITAIIERATVHEQPWVYNEYAFCEEN